MAHEQHRSAFASGNVLHLANSFLLKLSIADSEDFVNDQNLRVEVGCYSETQTDHHTATIALDWGVQIALTAREINNLIQLAGNLRFGHTQNSTIHVDILPTRHLWVETRTDLQKTGDTAALWLYVLAMCLSGFGLLIIAIGAKRRGNREKNQ